MEADLKPQTLFLSAVFTPIGLVINPQVVSVSLNSQQVNVEEQRQERDRYDTPTLNQEKPSEELDENRLIEQIGAWGKTKYWELKGKKKKNSFLIRLSVGS